MFYTIPFCILWMSSNSAESTGKSVKLHAYYIKLLILILLHFLIKSGRSMAAHTHTLHACIYSQCVCPQQFPMNLLVRRTHTLHACIYSQCVVRRTHLLVRRTHTLHACIYLSVCVLNNFLWRKLDALVHAIMLISRYWWTRSLLSILPALLQTPCRTHLQEDALSYLFLSHSCNL